MSDAPWLLLIHQIPPKPDYFRVKVRRRLARIGAVPLKNSVYVLHNTDEGREDFQWLAQEIRTEGGEATVAEASFITGITNEELDAMFEHGADEPAVAEPDGAERVEQGRTWVTRVGVKVDRVASAWLIRTFIDPAARFRFVPEKGYKPSPGELRFDMYEAEYTHEGEACTFEVLVRRFGLEADAGLRAIGEIVHDIDCKDDRYGRAETAGVKALIASLVLASADDAERLERGHVVFADLYRAMKA